MPFSFGGSSSKSRSQSSSFDRSSSSSVSGGASESSSEQALAFEDIFERLYGSAEGAAAGLDPSLLTQAADQLFGGGTGFLEGINSDPGTAFLEGRLDESNPILEQQIDLLGEDLGQFFREELNPAITSEAVATRTLGGGRQGVAQGKAIEEVGDQFTRGATALRAGDISARDAIAGNLAGNSIAGAQTAFAGLPALASIADFGFGAELAPAERLAAILGGPTTLTSASSSSADFASSLAESYGQSQASSRSKSKSAKIGFG